MNFSTEISAEELKALAFVADLAQPERRAALPVDEQDAFVPETPYEYLDRMLHESLLSSYQKQAQEKAKSDPKNVALLESILKLDEADRAEVELLLSTKAKP